MARINIEDDIESHEEFWKLFAITQDRDSAMGKLVRFFRLAQQKFGRKEVMTKTELEFQGLTCMIESGWAVPCGDGFQALGSEKQFAWYQQKVDNGKYGKLGGRPKKDTTSVVPEKPTRVIENPEEPSWVSPETPLSPSPSPSLSSSSSSSSSSSAETDEFVSAPGRGAIPELADVPGAKKLLWETTHEMQRHWLAFLPIGLIRDEIPQCWSKLLANEPRKAEGRWGLYANDWFKNSKKELEREIKAKIEASIKGKPPPPARSLRNTGKPCEVGYYTDGEGKQVAAGCMVHGFSDYCEMSGRAPP